MLNAVDKSKLRRMLAKGEKIQAIRFVMQQTGASLSEAKKYVERPQDADTWAEKVVYPPEPLYIEESVESTVCSLLVQGANVQATAYLRKQTGMSLFEAQQYMEALAPQVFHQKGLLQAQVQAKPKSFFTVMRNWSPVKKALLFLAIFVLPFLFMYLLICLDKLP